MSRPASSNWYILASGHNTFISLVLKEKDRCFSALQLKLLPLCSWPFEVSQCANPPPPKKKESLHFWRHCCNFQASCQTEQKRLGTVCTRRFKKKKMTGLSVCHHSSTQSQRPPHQTELPPNHQNCLYPLPGAKMVNDGSLTSNHCTADSHHQLILMSNYCKYL